MPKQLYRSDRSGDLELFDSPPASGWTFVGVVSSAATGDVTKLIEKQDQLAERERRQHDNLLKTRNALDEIAGALDSYVATPQSIVAAAAKARRPMDLDPIEAPSQETKAKKLGDAEF